MSTTRHTFSTSRGQRPLAWAAPALLVAALLAGCGSSEDPAADTSTDPATSTSDDDTATESDTESSTGTDTETDTGSQTSTEDPVSPSETATETESSVNPTDPADLPTGPVSQDVIDSEPVQKAIGELAEQEGVETDAVTVAGYSSVTWRSGAIGCPKPGQVYTMALVPGYQLVLEIDGELFSFNSAQDQSFAYCAAPEEPSPAGNS